MTDHGPDGRKSDDPAVADRQTDGVAALTHRAQASELMDDPGVDERELARALGFIRGVNRWLGGSNVAIARVAEFSTHWPAGRRLRVLDLGTGSADIPMAIVRWARVRGMSIHVTAIDLHEKTVAIAQKLTASSAEITVEVVDALRSLEIFGPRSFEVVHAGMFLHHLPDPDAVEMLRQMRDLCTIGAVWNDLRRSAIARLGVRILALPASPMVRHDAILSVEKGFTIAEAKRLALAAGWTNPVVHRHIFGRFTLSTGAAAP